MAITVTLGSDPIWANFDNVGRPFGGGFLASYSSENPTIPKSIFQDPAALLPYPIASIPNNSLQGILFNQNGNAPGPFYFKFDSTDPTNLYNLSWYDAQGNLVAQVLNYTPPSGGGSGPIVTDYFPLRNLVINNVFWRNLGPTAGTYPTGLPTNLVISPSNHAGLVSNPLSTNGSPGPDIIFLKNNTASTTDHIIFQSLAANTFGTSDTTPEIYLNYVCGDSPAGETYKLIQFPLNLHALTLSNRLLSISIWGILNSGLSTLGLRIRNFYGSGGAPSNDDFSSTQNITLTGSWTQSNFTLTVPNVSGKTLGTAGDDGVFLQILLPLGNPTNLGFIKPEIYLGNVQPGLDMQTYDEIDTIINSPRTGDIRTSLNSFYYFGWLPMNDGTIGDSNSNSTTRANIDTWPLFNLIWQQFNATPTQQAFAPMFTSAGMSTAYGATAIADWTANNQISLTRSLGRLLGGAGTAGSGLTARALGKFIGNETISISAMPTHHHGAAGNGGQFVVTGTGGNNYGSGAQTTGSQSATLDTGGSAADGNMPPITFMNIFIKL